MLKKKRSQKEERRKVVNFLGGLAYIVVVFQWVISSALFIPFLGNISLLKPEPELKTIEVDLVPTVESGEPSLLTMVVIAVALLFVLALTAYVLARMPATLARAGRKVVHRSSSALTTATIKVSKKKDTKKLRRKLTPRMVLIMKAVFVLIPIAIAYSSRFLDEVMLEEYIALYLAALLANLSFVLFAIQYGIAYALGVKRTDIW